MSIERVEEDVVEARAGGAVLRAAATCAVLFASAGCTQPEGVQAPRLGGPVTRDLSRLPECDPPDRPEQAPALDGLVLPEGAYVTVAQTEGPLTTANGWVDKTPVQLREAYDPAPAGWDLVTAEDEVVEAEVLLRSPEHRLLVVAQAACPTGSTLYVRLVEGDE